MKIVTKGITRLEKTYKKNKKLSKQDNVLTRFQD